MYISNQQWNFEKHLLSVDLISVKISQRGLNGSQFYSLRGHTAHKPRWINKLTNKIVDIPYFSKEVNLLWTMNDCVNNFLNKTSYLFLT